MKDEQRFRDIFRAVHAGHRACAGDEWLSRPCELPDGSPASRPIVWSRRNGPWRPVDLLWIGAAPGNAGGLGSGDMGAHGTRIPFGGDVAGGNLDLLLSAAGLTRNDSWIVASLNQLPEKGGGEPSVAEIFAPAGRYPHSVALLRDTIVATGPRLLVALGNVALRVTAAALTRDYRAAVGHPPPAGPDRAAPRLPGPALLARAGIRRGEAAPWPEGTLPPSPGFREAWEDAWGQRPLPHLLQVMHPSAQNMSPFAGADTVFHTRMIRTRDAVCTAVAGVLDRELPHHRPRPPGDGIYALPEWQRLVGPAHRRFDELWRAHGV
jgi:uracil-DNA glycosylase